jgi:hypothetical protein
MLNSLNVVLTGLAGRVFHSSWHFLYSQEGGFALLDNVRNMVVDLLVDFWVFTQNKNILRHQYQTPRIREHIFLCRHVLLFIVLVS